MHLGVLMFAACIVLSSVPAQAAERGVIIINPDGTVTESDAPKITRSEAPEVQEMLPEEKPEPALTPARKKPAAKPEKARSLPAAPKVTPKVEATPEQDPEAAHAAAKAKTLEHEQESVFTKDPEDTPVAAPAKAKSAPARIIKPKKVPAKAAAPATASAPKIKWNKAPKASKKQMKAEVAPTQVPASEPVPQPTGPISREDALRAAIKVAPPFKRSTVLPGNYKTQPVYEVILQTEDGEQSILIDAMTGDVISAK